MLENKKVNEASVALKEQHKECTHTHTKTHKANRQQYMIIEKRMICKGTGKIYKTIFKV